MNYRALALGSTKTVTGFASGDCPIKCAVTLHRARPASLSPVFSAYSVAPRITIAKFVNAFSNSKGFPEDKRCSRAKTSLSKPFFPRTASSNSTRYLVTSGPNLIVTLSASTSVGSRPCLAACLPPPVSAESFTAGLSLKGYKPARWHAYSPSASYSFITAPPFPAF